MLSRQLGPMEDQMSHGGISSGPSPSLSHRSVPSTSVLDLDLTMTASLSKLVDHLVNPLGLHYPPNILDNLRIEMIAILTKLYAPTWDEKHPQHGSGVRSLICKRELGLPKPLRLAAKSIGVDEAIWIRVLTRPVNQDDETESRRRPDEWEAWCDPGGVTWRYGDWEWEDIGFEPLRIVREPFKIIWQSSASPRPAPPAAKPAPDAQNTPNRPSHAIPIRAPVPLPAVFAIPPTPAHNGSSISTIPNHSRVPSTSLLPAVRIGRTPSPSHSDISSGYESSSYDGKYHSHASTNPSSIASNLPKSPSRGHRGAGSGSTSSVASSVSDNSGVSQLLTPDSRPPSADMFISKSKSPTPTGPQRGRTPSPSGTPRDSTTPSTAASATPTVTPYDGGNVTVLGGGVKLGGSSRPSSVMSTNRTPIDRSRSPSISLASRALTSAMGPNATRKTRTRRRIMPTYLGHLGQPGVGGPITGAFSGIYTSYSQPGTPWTGVGVGMAPPPAQGLGRPLGQPRVSSA